MSPRVRRQLGSLLAIAAMLTLSVAVTAFILDHQRVRFPIVESAPFKLGVELDTAQAVTPGQGQTVQVSGVRIGDIVRVELRGGRAIVWLDIDQRYRRLIHTDATALLRPRTGLKDMFLEVDPGSHSTPVAKEGWIMPASRTLPDVNLDEVTQVLDEDTRSYLQLLVGDGARGLTGRGDDLREVLRRFEPTHRDLARVNGALVARRADLRGLVHSLRLLSGELAQRDDTVADLVSASADSLGAFAQEDSQVSAGVHGLPRALAATRRALGELGPFSEELGRTSRTLTPVVNRMPAAATALTRLSRTATPVLRTSIRPFVRESRPLVGALRQPARDLATSMPLGTRVGVRLNRLFNMLAYNRDGREGPSDANRDEGYLFWLAWTTHVGLALFSTGDANGPFRAITQQGNCASLLGLADTLGQGDPLVGAVLGGLQGPLSDPRVCGQSLGSGAAAKRLAGGPRIRPRQRRTAR